MKRDAAVIFANQRRLKAAAESIKSLEGITWEEGENLRPALERIERQIEGWRAERSRLRARPTQPDEEGGSDG